MDRVGARSPYGRQPVDALPGNALALSYLGAAAFAQGDKPAAARRWKTLLALLPADASIRDAGGKDQGRRVSDGSSSVVVENLDWENLDWL